jgi:outer membrane protein assembly factor BamB
VPFVRSFTLALLVAGTAGPLSAQGTNEADALWSGDLHVARRVSLAAAPAAEAALLDRVAFVPLRDGRIQAVHLDTGDSPWTADVPTTLALAAGDGAVFAATDRELVGLGSDGKPRWSVQVPGGFSAPPAWDAGWLIATTKGGEVLAVRSQDGQVLWTANVAAPVVARPAIGHDRVYLSLEDGHVAALDLRTGALAWQQRLGGRPGAPLVMIDRVFVGAADRWFYCLSTKDGGRKWRWRHGGLITAPAAVDARHVYVTGYNNVLRALDRSGGSQRWMRGLPMRPIGGPLVLHDVVAVAGIGGDVRTFRSSPPGQPAGEFTGTSDLAAPPALVPHPVAELTGVVLLTRSGELQFLRRPLSIKVVPLREIFGVPVPLGAPPAP